MNHFFSITFCCVFISFCFFSCMDKVTMMPSYQIIKLEENTNNDTVISCNDTISNSDTLAFQLVNNGTVYFHCDFGPYYFTLDSLLNNGSFSGNLLDSAFHLQYGINPNANSGLHYDSDQNKLSDPNNLDFTISRIAPLYNKFEISHNFSNSTIDSLNYVFGTDTLNNNNHPFYNGIKLSNSNFELQLYFFNKYIGGCYHDEMVWFYFE